jgi:hypothetical protein
VARALPRVLTLGALVLAAGLLTQPVTATEPELHVVSTGATVGTPVPGAYLTADLVQAADVGTGTTEVARPDGTTRAPPPGTLPGRAHPHRPG